MIPIEVLLVAIAISILLMAIGYQSLKQNILKDIVSMLDRSDSDDSK
jgi:hypothetical protein